MSFTNSLLAIFKQISPNRNSPRNQPITKITIHHMAGIMTLEQFGNLVANPAREMSANYAIDNDGRIGLFCEEKDRSWCSSSAWNDNRAITIEVSNDVYGEPWSISNAAYTSLIKLCVDICKRNGIKKLEFTGDKNGSLTYHYMFAATQCPATWIKNHTQEICNKVNAQLNQAQTTITYKVNDLVSIKSSVTYYDGGSIPTWVTQDKWYISSISGDRAVLGQNEAKTKNIQSPINTKDITLVKSSKPNFNEYTKILNAGTPIYKDIGKNATDKIATTTKYTIVDEKVVDYIKYGKLKSGVGWVVVERLKRTFNINNTNDVKELQMTLASKGFDCGEANGIVGDKTINAMFQALCEQWLQIR